RNELVSKKKLFGCVCRLCRHEKRSFSSSFSFTPPHSISSRLLSLKGLLPSSR
ncbi:hypothetical protein CSUI_011071, partial [Cystoisospora suis]